MKIRDMYKTKPVALQTITPEASVHDVVVRLNEYNIGALPVCDASGDLVGIITERDIMRLCADAECATALASPVAAAMTRNLATATADDTVESAMRTMTERRVRHLPILDGTRLVNIISIGDIVKSQLDEFSAENRFLRDYVTG